MNQFILYLTRFPWRVLLFYWLCFIFPFPFDLVGLPVQLIEPNSQPAWMKPYAEYYGKAYSWIFQTKNEVCQWIGPKVFDKPVVIQMTGSGDTMRNYVGCFCAVVLAVGLALCWSILIAFTRWFNLRWNGDRWLHGVVRVFVRFFLIQVLFSYGFAKVFPLQFAPPNSFRLNQQLGDMSPMGLLWTFMGFSTPYQMFTGAVEVLAGILLVTRRTTMLGALVTIAAMTQIFALNMCFDVPVKLYSFHYLMMGVFLLLPDMPRLFNLFVLGRAAEPSQFPWFCNSKWCSRLALAFRTLLVTAMLFGQIQVGYKQWNDTYGGTPPPVQGRWQAVAVILDGKPAAHDDSLNWKYLDFASNNMVRITSPKPPILAYKSSWNVEEKTLVIGKFSNPMWSARMQFELPAQDQIKLSGTIEGRRMEATFRSVSEKKSELMNRGFHWIQEMPYNR